MKTPVISTLVLGVATTLAMIGVGGLILHEVRAAERRGRRVTADLGWTLLWATGLAILFVAAWRSLP